MTSGRSARKKGIAFQNRVANLLQQILDRPFARNLEEYRLANDGDVAEKLVIENGRLVNRPLPLWIECKAGKLDRGVWKNAILQAADGVEASGDGEVPVGWIKVERLLHPASFRGVLLEYEGFRRLTWALIEAGVWDFPGPWDWTKVEGDRPRWRKLVPEVLGDACDAPRGRYCALRTVVTGDRPLDVVWTTEETFLTLLAKIHDEKAWEHVRVPPF